MINKIENKSKSGDKERWIIFIIFCFKTKYKKLKLYFRQEQIRNREISILFSRLALICTSAQLSSQNLTKIKKEIQASVEQQKDQLIATSDAIWEAAETSLEEYKSSKQLKDYARAKSLLLKMLPIFLQHLWRVMVQVAQSLVF